MKPETELIDKEHRERAAQDLSQSYIVEAAAGTGKTTLLVSRILNLIKEGEARLEEVVAITFTEKAAAELKVKLRQELEKSLPMESDPAKHQRISEAISDLERMQVTTIHSFCGSLLRERPVEAGLDPNFEVADGLMARLVQAEVWEEWFEKQMDEDDPALRRATLFGIRPDQIRKMAQSMIENRDVLNYLPSPEPSEVLEKAVKQFVRDFRKGVETLNGFKVYCQNSEDQGILTIEELNEKLMRLESISDIEEKERFIVNEIPTKFTTRGNKKNWKPNDQLNIVKDHFTALSKRIGETQTLIAESVMTELAHCLTDSIEAYEQAKEERNLLDFQDLLLFTRKMLKDHLEVRRYFQDRYRFLLVDEFQDTDPLQAEIVFFLSEEERGKAKEWKEVRVSPKRLFLVGDPKQSIYRFRRADIEMYEEAKTKMGKNGLLTISQNFRCAPSLTEKVNQIFADLIQAPEDGCYQPGYVELNFGRKKETLPPDHGTVLLYPPKRNELTMTSMDECRTWEARCIAAFIQKLVSEEKWKVWDDSEQCLRPILFKDIAILMRTYNPLPFLEEALRSHEVDYRVMGGKYFYRRQEVQQLLAVLKAIDNPIDKVALVAALRSPFFGISDEELFLFHAGGGNLNYLQEAQGSPMKEPFRLLRKLHKMRNESSVSALLKRLYEETSGLVLFLLRPQGEQRVANLQKIGDMARALEERGMLSFRGFVRWLSERQEEEAEEEEPPTLERGDNFVRLLTIHRAKGLEFPMVILADLGRKENLRENLIIDRSGERVGIKAGDEKSRFWTRNFKELNKWEEKRAKAEERRLLYVGMTRARDFLVLPVFWVKKEDGRMSIPKSSFLTDLQRYLKSPDQVPFGRWEEGVMYYDTDQLELKPKEGLPFRFPFDIEKGGGKESKVSLSERKKWKEAQEALKERAGRGRCLTTATEQVKEFEKDDEWEISPVTGGEGAIFGKLVHRLFEKMDWSQPDLLEKMAEMEGKGVGATGSMIKKAGEMVKKSLASSLLQRVIQSDHYQKEVPFTFRCNGTLFEGVMDVVFKEDGGLVVLDFKTDLLEKENLGSRVGHYRPQVEIYSDAIQTIFGKPPKEVILFFLHLMEPVSIRIT